MWRRGKSSNSDLGNLGMALAGLVKEFIGGAPAFGGRMGGNFQMN